MTINDFPSHGNLSGCTVKGYKACPVCGDRIDSKRLLHGRKCTYGGHRKYLPKDHKFRKQKKLFDGHEEHGQPPIPLTEDEILQWVEYIPNEWGKNKRKRGKDDNMESTHACWKKKSIF